MGNWTSSDQDFPITIRNSSKYGWKPDIPDRRDIWAQFPAIKNSGQIDLRNQFMPKIYDQESLGSCTANALAAAFEYDQKKQNLEIFEPSRLFIYFNERAIEGTITQDSGGSIRDGMKVLHKLGVCPEEECPYDITFFADRPTIKSYKDAQKHKSIIYRRIRSNARDFRNALDLGYPIVFGFSVPKSFEDKDSAPSGVMKMPDPREEIMGGHTVLAVGYDDNKEINGERGFVLVRNSQGVDFGIGGYFWMPYSFINTTTCGDSWLLKKVITVTKNKDFSKTNHDKEVNTEEEIEEIEEIEEEIEQEPIEEQEQIVYNDNDTLTEIVSSQNQTPTEKKLSNEPTEKKLSNEPTEKKLSNEPFLTQREPIENDSNIPLKDEEDYYFRDDSE
jgi:hypothetical protein